MSHFAEIDKEGIVLRVIVADQDFIDSGAVGDPATWIQTSYNTSAGEHKEGQIPLRMNYAGIGYTYDKERDAFVPPKPEIYPSFVLDEKACLWAAPVPQPPGRQIWSEKQGAWVDMTEKSTEEVRALIAQDVIAAIIDPAVAVR